MIVAIAQSLLSESLWDPKSQGLFSGSNAIQTGDTVLLSIDSETSLSYNATRVDNERVTLELSGGSAGNLFDFLPAGSASGNQTLKGGEGVSISASFAVRVVAVDETQQLIIQGSRSFIIQGKEETISVNGVLDPKFVREDGTVPLSRVANARVSYTTLLEPDEATLQAEDIVEESAVLPADASGAAPAATALSDERRQELLLLFINRIVDLIFR